LREELTPARIDRHAGQLEELDVEGILAFAERVLPRASDLWVQATLDQRQRFQQLFFPNGIAFDGNRFIGTGVTAPAFSYWRCIRSVRGASGTERPGGAGASEASLSEALEGTARRGGAEHQDWWTRTMRVGTASPDG
jgi:hypothetical protein